MRPIQMVDLVGQYQGIRAEVEPALLQVIEQAQFINGPEVLALATELAEYLNVKHVIPCGNGTDALQIAMMALDLQPGDEVIAPSFTFVATAEVIALLKLSPVLVDVDPNTFTLDIEAVRRAITPRTKAIVPVHLFGQCAEMGPLLQLAEEHGLYIIEDTAQAIGADYVFPDGKHYKAGSLGLVGATSFYPSKNLGCYGDGGAVFTNNDSLAEQLRMIANHGMKRRYYYDTVGINSRLDSFQAVVLRRKLPHLNDYNERRRLAADVYDRAFGKHPHLQIPQRAPYSTHVFHQYTIRVLNGKRDELLAHLQAKQVPCAVFYPVPLHLQPPYRDDRYAPNAFATSEMLAKQVISLPMHTELDHEQLEYITQTVLTFFE